MRPLLIIGERLNTTRESVSAMVTWRDAAAVQQEAVRQVEAGADYIDVNAGTFVADEPECLRWLVETVQRAVPSVPLCIDSPNPEAIRAALAAHRGKAIVNSISGEKARFERVLPLVREHRAAVVVLCLDDAGLPATPADAAAKGSRLVQSLLKAGVHPGDIYVDPLVRPVGTDLSAGTAALEALRRLREKFPGVHFICGASNVSFGLPQRSLLNRAFLVAAMAAGLDAAILDPLDRPLLAAVLAAEAVLGQDPHCSRYLKAYRAGKLGGPAREPGRGPARA